MYPDKRLGVPSFKTTTVKSIDDCVKECATFPDDCFSFNYAHILKTCQILSEIAGASNIEIQTSDEFYYYERKGIGSHKNFTHENLPLVHNELYFLNVYVNNTLEYESYLSSEGMLIDFTPPEPGKIANVSRDDFIAAGCTAAINQRCVQVTPDKNYRIVVDGIGSDCIFNGPSIRVELMYTRLNSFVSITFFGFHDNESDIYAYTWSLGYEYCGNLALSPRDPRADATTVLSDPVQGRIEQHFDDGIYYATVQALNQVIFGGSGVLALCHSTPYIIDTSRPIIYSVKLIAYNETSNITTFYYSAVDEQSGLQQVYVGAGLTYSDTLVLSWEKIFTNNTATLLHKINVKDGTRAFVRIRAVNNVDLESTSFGTVPIQVDRTPPIAGQVLDGDGAGNSDWKYQPSGSTLCVKWRNFFDPESGISAYRWGAGTSPGLSNTVPFTSNLPNDQESMCSTGLNLIQNTTYYSTIIAFNGDTDHPRNTSASSNGVLVDLTNPIAGFVRDGLNINGSLNYTYKPTTVQAVWSNFSDPESHMAQYNATIYIAQVLKYLPSDGSPDLNQTCPVPSNNSVIPVKPPFIPPASVKFSIAQDLGSVGLASQIDVKHFHFPDGTFVKTEIVGQDGATRTTVVISQGFLIDLTPPISIHLYDGGDPYRDEDYQLSIDSLQASWIMIDPESGIEEYLLSVYVRTGGSKSQFYPADNKQITVQPQVIGESGQLTCWTLRNIQLAVGSQYIVRVEVVNRAGISTSYESTGIIPDNTPPTIDFLHIDTYGDLSEDLDLQGAVEIGNSGGIPVQWAANDPDSGVQGYEAAVGTTENSTDISNYTLYPASENVFINVKLELFEQTGKYYYVIAKAVNGVGLLSNAIVSTKIKVLRANVAGVVTVGHSGVGISGKFQAERDTVTLKFEGFSSELCGIQYYEWSIGTSFAEGQIQESTTAGVTDNGEGSGEAQSLVTLYLNETLYTEVKAITACSAGDGQDTINSYGQAIKVDWTVPSIKITELGRKKGGDPFIDPPQDESIYQFDTSTLVAEWEATDLQSGIANAYYIVGTAPYRDNVAQPTYTNRSSLINNEVKPNTTSKPNILQITVYNNAGLSTFHIAPGVTISISYPNISATQFVCTEYALQMVSQLNCKWSGAIDKYSNVYIYQILLGGSEGSSEYIFKEAFPGDSSIVLDDFSRDLLDGEYVYTLNIINNVGLLNNVFDFLTIDNTLPIPQSIDVLIDQTFANFFATGELNSTLSYNNISSSTQCKAITTELRVRWDDFLDFETPMEHYEIGIGDTAGEDNVLPFITVGLVNEYLIQGLDLMDYYVYVTIRGVNLLGLTSAITSKRIAITVHNPDPPTVDDPSFGPDFETQTSTFFIQGEWDFGDPCSEIYYEWGVFYMNETTVQNYTKVSTIDSYNDNVVMAPETKVYLLVNLFSPLGYRKSARSDPIFVEIDPLIPGLVFDGPFTGLDFNHQASLVTLSANWNSFGGSDHTKISQTIHKYEIAAGTQPRGKDLFNVSPYQDINLNETFTLMALNLTLNNTYYVTIRATSATNQIAEVTSNGIQPIHFDRISQPGHVKIPYFQSATTVIDITWNNFTSLLPFIYYEYGISTNGSLTNTSCYKSNAEKNLKDYFDVLPFTKVTTVGSAVVSQLQLEVGPQYYAYVRTIDDAFQCSTAVSNPLSVDITPPITGEFIIGFDTRSFRMDNSQPQISYITTNNSLSVAWIGFYDPESSVKSYQIALIELTACNLTNCDQLSNLTIFTTLTNVTNHTFYVLDIIDSNFYYVALRALNRAGLTSCTVSQPVLLDRDIPNQAVVKHGSNWKVTPPYQGNTSSINGILALVTDQHEAVCMDRMYNESSSAQDWNTITQSETPTIPVGPNNPTGRTLAYCTKQAKFNTNSAFLEISMTRDLQNDRMLSAAVATQISVVDFNEMSVSIKSAPEYQAVTSVLVWDGPSTIIEDFEVIDNVVSSNSSTQNITSNNANNSSSNSSYCQYMPPANPNPIPYKSFGLQLHPAYNATGAQALLWYRGNVTSETAYTWITLGFDPTTSYHTYQLTLEKVASSTPSTVKKATWSVLLKVDSQYVASLVDLPEFNSSLYYALHVRNYNGRVEPINDPFSPSTTSAYFSDIILPVDSTRVCKFGAPFYSSRAPFVKFEVGVGLSYGSTNLSKAAGQEYQPIPLPCIPCYTECSHAANSCNSSCDSEVHYITFEATGLKLLPGCTYPANQTNITCTPYNYTASGIPEDQLYLYNLTFVPYVYYIKVRGYTGAGHIAYGYSRGINLDPTPPNCTKIQHIQEDLRSDEVSNTTVQYSTNSLAVLYECSDTASDIYGYEIAYSDNIDDINSLQFNSVGTDNVVNITNLSLNPQLKYYVVVRATNGAGLITILKSKGVRILNKEPDVSRAVLHSLNSTEVKTIMPNASVSSKLTSIGLNWTGFYETSYEEDYIVKNQTLFWKIGSEYGWDDIFPTFEITYNSSFSIRIEDITLIGNNSFYASNITDLAKLANKTNYIYEKGDLIMDVEPGRIFYQTLILCAIQPKCISAGTHSVTFYREGDKYYVYNCNAAEDFTISVSRKFTEGNAYAVGEYIPGYLYPTRCTVSFSEDIQHKSGYLIGDLPIDDLRNKYDVISAPTSTPYTPYIVDPSSTLHLVDRLMFSRVVEFHGPSFYVSPIGGGNFSSFMKIQIEFDLEIVTGDVEPILLGWNPDVGEWIASRSSCNFTYNDTIHNRDTLTTYFCPCNASIERCNKPWQFILIVARKGLVDTAPIPDTVPCISISEDTGTIQHLLSYTDREDDTVRYNLTSVVFTQSASEYPVVVPPAFSVEINDSVLYVTPPRGISGNITINFTLLETGTPASLGIPLSAKSQVTVYILLKNHNPILLGSNNTQIEQYIVYIDEIDSTTQHNFTFYSYDKDKGDKLIFKYKNCSYCDIITREQTPSNSNKVPAEYRNTSSKSIVEYSPTKGYYGSDELGVVAEDNNGAYSELVFLSLSVRYKPCLNGGICKGPKSDPNCSRIIRPEDFTVEYKCECTKVWSMRRCDTPNVCYSQPCPFNTSCIIKDSGGFECICQPEWPCSMYPHTDPQNTWIIAAIAISSVFLLILIAVFSILLFINIIQPKTKRVISLEISLEELREIHLERWTGDEIYSNVIDSPLEQSTQL